MPPLAQSARGAQSPAWLILPGGKTHLLDKPTCSIGRTPPQDVLLSHPFVSGKHAVIEVDARGNFLLRDLGSKNGTYIEGAKLTSPTALRNGAKIRIGEFELLFRSPSSASARSSTQIQDLPLISGGLRTQPRSIALLTGATLGDTALKSFLVTQPDLRVVHSVKASSAMLRLLRSQPVAMVIVNLSTAELDALAFLQDIASLDTPPSVFLTGGREHSVIFQRALAANALGASFDSDNSEETLACIRGALMGIKSLTRSVASMVSVSGSSSASNAKASGPANLSDREIAVFNLIGIGKQNREIAEILGVSVKTVETHKEHIKEKLGITNSARLADVARGWVENSKH